MIHAEFHALIWLLHGCVDLLTPHIMKVVDKTHIGGHRLQRVIGDLQSIEDAPHGDFGVAFEKFVLGGVLAAPEPTFSTLSVVCLRDRSTWPIPRDHCARVLQEIDRWMHPTGLGRICKCLRPPFPANVFDHHIGSLQRNEAVGPAKAPGVDNNGESLQPQTEFATAPYTRRSHGRPLIK